jgi:hypothetical protein
MRIIQIVECDCEPKKLVRPSKVFGQGYAGPEFAGAAPKEPSMCATEITLTRDKYWTS